MPENQANAAAGQPEAEIQTAPAGEKAAAAEKKQKKADPGQDKKKFHLFYKFTVVISLLLVVILGITGFILISLQEQSLLNEKKRSARKLIEFVATSSAYQIERYSYFMLHKNAEMLQSGKDLDGRGVDADVVSVLVTDPTGKPLHLNGKGLDEIKIPPEYLMTLTEKCVYRGGGAERHVGNCRMIFSLIKIHDNIVRMRLTFLLIVLAVLLIIDGVMAYLLVIFITRPLSVLKVGAEQISGGNFDLEIPIDSQDEIGSLAGSISKMSSDLKTSFSEIEKQKEEIQKYSETLEERVEQRTAELNNANEELTEINKKFRSELEMARRVQQGIIPDEASFPRRDEMRLASVYESMGTVGGDLYDVIRIGKNSYGFLIADVSGHGVPAALITTMAKVSFNTHSHWGTAPAQICDKVNRETHQLIADLGYYLTAYYGILDLEDGRFEYTNAGHHPALLCRAEDGKVEKLDTEGLFIGISENGKYTSGSAVMAPGDKILLFTDGIVEARNDAGEKYGFERLIPFFADHRDMRPKDLVAALLKEIDKFYGVKDPDDDRAALVIEFMQPAPKISGAAAAADQDVLLHPESPDEVAPQMEETAEDAVDAGSLLEEDAVSGPVLPLEDHGVFEDEPMIHIEDDSGDGEEQVRLEEE